jgi:pyridoxal phosphate enzyme (YggS family)
MKIDYADLYQTVTQRIQKAQTTYQTQPVKLLAVSKTKPIQAIDALHQLGQTAFGENYLQEAIEKIQQRPNLEWHFIGPIQSNKTKLIAENFNWVESVDRLKIAQRLSAQRPQESPALNVLLQVNISRETSKSGFLPEELIENALLISQLPGLQIRGLMTIPKIETEFYQQYNAFRQAYDLYQALKKALPNLPIDTLSMGMSSDLEAAIKAGSTQVRIGTDLFGAR